MRRTLFSTAIALLASVSTSATAQIHVGSGVSNTTVATGAGTVYLFDEGNAVLTNSSTILGNGDGASTVVATNVGNTTLINSGQMRALGDDSTAVEGVSRIVNSGFIRSLSGEAIRATSGDTLIVNEAAGRIISDGAHAISVASAVSDSRVASTVNNTTLINSGQVRTTGGTDAIAVDKIRTVVNNGFIRSSGIAVNMVASGGSVFNGINGKIVSDGAYAITVATDVNVASNIASTSLINQGQIRAGSVAVKGVKNITNSGYIRSGFTAIEMDPTEGTIRNEAGGDIISDGLYAINVARNSDELPFVISRVPHTASDVGNITLINEGNIRLNSPSGAAITRVTTVENSGTIRSKSGIAISMGIVGSSVINRPSGQIVSEGFGGGTIQDAEIIENEGIIRSLISDTILVGLNGSQITNKTGGKIIAGQGTAITVATNVSNSTITNDGEIRATGNIAIDNSYNANALTIDNSGVIRGDVLLGRAADKFTITGGKVIGDIVGQGNDDTLNFSAQGFRTRGTISNISEINVSSGLLVLDHDVTSQFGTFNIDQSARVIANKGFGDSILANGGLLEVTANNNAEMASFAHFKGATLRSHVDGDSHGMVKVSSPLGDASLEEGSNIDLGFEAGRAVSNNESFKIIEADSLTFFGGATDENDLNYTSNNAFITLTPSVANDDLFITTSTATPAAAALNVLNNANIESPAQLRLLAGGDAAGENTAQSLRGFSSLMTEIQSADADEFQRINAEFGDLDGAQAVEALSSVDPNAAAIAGSAAAIFSATSSANSLVSTRLDHARQTSAKVSELGEDLQVWAQPFASRVNRGIYKGVSGFDAGSYGLLFGADLSVSDKTRLGASFGYSDTDINLHSSGNDSVDIESYQASLYGTYSPDSPFFIDAMLGLGFSEFETREVVSFLGAQTEADFDGMHYNARLGAGYDFATDNGFVITPNAFLQYTRLEQDGYTTTGNGVNRQTDETSIDSLVTSLGVKVAYSHKLENGDHLVPYMRGSYLYEAGDEDQAVTSRFVNGGSSFTTTSPMIDRHALHVGGGVDFHTTSDVKVGANVDYVSRDDQNSLSGALRVRIPF